MPELPEVETIARGLKLALVGRRITDVSFLGVHLVGADREGFRNKLVNRTIRDVHRRGKLLLIELDSKARLAFHLRMTGRLGLMPARLPPARHVHLLLPLDNETALYFQDQRKFGTCRHLETGELEAWPFYQNLGPEPLTLSAADFTTRLQARKGRIKALLLNQGFIAGIGNIYADESLFRAGIHPATPADGLSPARINALHAAIRSVLTEAIAAGGSSIRDYRTAAGLVGSFQNDFQVYGRKGQPCPQCHQPIRTAKVAGRTSAYCPRCQPEPTP